MPNPNKATFNWRIWLQWVFATALGWLAGIALIPRELGIGIFIGMAQWLVLRPVYPRAYLWVMVSALGWSLGWGGTNILALPQPDLYLGTILGTVTGLAQWTILQRWVHQAGWWIIISILGWTLALSGFTSIYLVGAIAGITTGIAIELLTRYPK